MDFVDDVDFRLSLRWGEKDFFPQLVGREFFGWETKEKFYDIGTPERLAYARETLK